MGLFDRKLTELTLTPEEIGGLALEDLARLILRDLSRERTVAISLHNWVTEVRRRYQKGEYHRTQQETLGAFAEAVGWLRQQLYLTDDYSVAEEGSWVRLSRAGRAWLAGTDEW
jgi:hypothetical protein